MNDFPDVLGMELHDATALLEAEGLAFIILETKPSKRELTEGVLRVIRARTTGPERTVELTVCRI